MACSDAVVVVRLVSRPLSCPELQAGKEIQGTGVSGGGEGRGAKIHIPQCDRGKRWRLSQSVKQRVVGKKRVNLLSKEWWARRESIC